MNFLDKSKKGIYTINNEQLEKLQEVWEKEQKINDVKKILMYEIEGRFAPASWIVLYGETPSDSDEGIKEHYIGRLNALERGIVILESDEYQGTLTGLLKRSEKPPRLSEKEWSKKRNLFHLRCFKKFPGPDFRISFNDKPAIITNHLKHFLYHDANRDQYSYLGISESRWKVMQAWLDEWLPK